MKSVKKRSLSLLLAVLMMLGCVTPAFSALADDGVIGVYELQIFYDDGVIVPDYDIDEETGSKTEHLEYMMEGDKVQFRYQFVDCDLPDNGYVKWSSDTPTVCDVTPEGIVRAFDSSKGAAVRLWLDNEVATIPLVGGILKSALEKVLFNDTVNVDTMDTDAIIKLVEDAFGSDSVLGKYVDSYKGELIDSLRSYLDKVNTTIYCTMYDKDGTVLAQDSFKVCVQKSDAFYADFLPNGTHITNKADLPTTVAKGSKLQLYACTTPTRLHMGVIYSVKNSSIFTNGKVIATVDDSGLVTFKNTGTVTILVSPDTDGFIQNLLELVNYIYKLENTGTIDTGKIADILIKYVGLDMNRTVLMGILDTIFIIADIAGDTADPVQLSATAVKIIANLILQFTTNDSITFEVVNGVPLEDFEIVGADTVKEGTQIALDIDNVQPVAADTSDIIWTSSDPSIASVDPETGVITGRDAGSALGALASQEVTITATSQANNVSKSVKVKVTGRTGYYLSDAEILAESDMVNIGEQQALTAKVYPARMQDSNLLYIYWGIVTSGENLGNYEYAWASEPYQEVDEEGNAILDEESNPVMNDGTVSDGIGVVDVNGNYTALHGGTALVACRAVTGSKSAITGKFNTISEVITVKEICNGLPIDSISLSAVDISNRISISPKLSTYEKEIYGNTVKTATIDYSGSVAGLGCKIQATIDPEEATNKHLIWKLEGSSDYSLDDQNDDDGTVVVRVKAGVEKATSVNVYCTSADGDVKSDVIAVTVSKNPVTSNSIDVDNVDVINQRTATVTHTNSFSGSMDGAAYACKQASWYSEDEEICVVESVDSDGNAVIRGMDVGTTTLTCVSSDGALTDTCTVTVYPDKDNLKEIIALCERTTIRRTAENAADYKTYMKCLDRAYYVMEDVELASQTVVDTYAEELLYIFYKLGGYVGVNGVTILDQDGNKAPTHVSVKVDTALYTKARYSLGYLLNPEKTMFKSISWKSDSSDVTVDKFGICKPSGNKACYATITVTVTDYLGTQFSDSVIVAFAKDTVTGVSIDPDTITGGKVGETVTLKAKLEPSNALGTTADVKAVTWKSNDESVATVDQNGVVTFVYGGDCIVTATTADGGYVGECAVNVVTNYTPLIEAINTYNGMALSPDNYYPDTYEVYAEALQDAQAMLDAQNSTQREVRDMVQRLTDAYNGLEKYTYIQNIEIYEDGKPTSDYYQYDVSILSDGIRYTNVKFTLKVRLYPNNASYDRVIWESDNPNIEIDSAGNCSIKENNPQRGVITCTVTDHFGNSWVDTVNVSVTRYPVTSVSIAESEISGEIGSTYQLNHTVAPTGTKVGSLVIGGATIPDVTWSSSNEDIATVDANGVVTFVSAGAATITVTTVDGGYTAQCVVSTEGDRAALNELIEQYSSVDYMDYDYEYGMAFKQAYENAVSALTDNTLTQSQIDAAAQALQNSADNLAGHEFHMAQGINIAYENQQATAIVNKWSSKGSGTLAADATAYSYKKDDGRLNIYNSRVILNASLDASVSGNYTAVDWRIAERSSDTECTIDGSQIIVTSSKESTDAAATLIAVATDVYGRTVERTLRVVISEKIATGISISQTNVVLPADSQPFTLSASFTPSDAKNQTVIWTSSDESIATVDANGTVTPANSGTCTITARAYDGDFTASCTVTLTTNFGALVTARDNYKSFAAGVYEEHIYTSQSLSYLQKVVADADEMIAAGTADQAAVNAMIEELDNAYNSLVLFVPINDVAIILPEQDKVSVINEGFIRYEADAISGASFTLSASALPEGSTYETISYSSSNENVTVSENGVVAKSRTTSNEYAVITVTLTDEAGNVATDSVYVSFVRRGITSISISKSITYGRPGATDTLSVSVSPTLFVTKDAIWESSDESVATVDQNGVVTFVAGGECTITATAVDGGLKATATAYTTADTSALSAAVNNYSGINYMDYAYDYGMEFKAAYEAAQEVLQNYLAPQEEIDAAAARLETAYNELSGNEFIGTGEITFVSGGVTLADGAKLAMGDNGTAGVGISYNREAMLQSAEITVANENGVTAHIVDDTVIIEKTTEAPSGSIDITFTAVDVYGRETVVTKSLIIVDAIVPISSFVFVNEAGEQIDSATFTASSLLGITNKTIQLGIRTYPENAEEYKSISWSASGYDKISVDQNGLVKMGTTKLGTNSYSSTITCILTLNDGTMIVNTIVVTFAKA